MRRERGVQVGVEKMEYATIAGGDVDSGLMSVYVKPSPPSYALR